jgi:hypothetical protein
MGMDGIPNHRKGDRQNITPLPRLDLYLLTLLSSAAPFGAAV